MKKKDKFAAAFDQKLVQILCDTGDPNTHMPLLINGFIVDSDDEYYYIGENIIEVTSAIKRKNAYYISIIEEKDPQLKLLEDFNPSLDETN